MFTSMGPIRTASPASSAVGRIEEGQSELVSLGQLQVQRRPKIFSFLELVEESVSLPSYADISPVVEYNQNNPIVAGNPYLKPATAWNLDLGVSFFSNDVGLFTVDLFYKQISDLMYGPRIMSLSSTFPSLLHRRTLPAGCRVRNISILRGRQTTAEPISRPTLL